MLLYVIAAWTLLVPDLTIGPEHRRALSDPSADTIVVNSKILGRARRVFVSVPASQHRTSRPYPVVVVLDGEANFAPAATITATLARLGHFPEAIVVAIPNVSADPRDRVHDMTPPGLSVSGSSLNEGGDLFLDFIEKEVLPLVRTRYRGGAPHMLVGHSSGGVIATHAAATRPKVFPVVVSIDAPIWVGDNWLARRLLESARMPVPTALRYVSLETRFGWPDSLWNALEAVAPATWRIKREVLEGESHESMGFLAMYEGLKHAFADYSIVGAPLVPRATATAAFNHYRGIESELGAILPPPAPVLRQMIEDLLTEAQIHPARRALRWLIDGYGAQSDAAKLEQDVAAAAALPPLTETVASLKATPLPTAAEIAPYVGTWRGEQWLNPQSKNPIALRIRIEGGKVIAEKLLGRSGRASPVEYLKVVDGGLHFGSMNGMRPMAMVVSEGKLTGNVLEGRLWFRGVRLPPEMPNGEISFRLVKQ
jgi:hypothetical protein